MAMLPLEDARKEFAPETVYVNTASIGLPPRRALDALAGALETWRSGRAEAGAYDVFVTTPNAPLTATTPVAAAVLGGVNSGFVGVDVTTPKQIRITTANSTTVVLDLGTVTFIPDVNTILVIAPPSPAGNTVRAFLVAGC